MKTKLRFVGPPEGSLRHHPQLHTLTSSVNTCVKNLGVLLDSDLKLDKQVNSVVRSCFTLVGLLTEVKPFLCPQANG